MVLIQTIRCIHNFNIGSVISIDIQEIDIMGNGKFDPSRLKEKKHRNKKIVVEDFDDTERLRIQGLMRCLSCKTPYPLNFDNCPSCKDGV
jgi:hypothetical protein